MPWLFQRSFESPPAAAPVTAAIFAVPFGHAFPFFAVSGYGPTFIDGLLQRWSWNTMNNGDDMM